MTRFEIVEVQGLDAFHAIAPVWNDLWSRCHTCPPTVRSEAIELWVRMFSAPERLTVVAVGTRERFFAAMAVVRQSISGSYPFHTLTANCWSHNGDLLLDPTWASDEIVATLLRGLRKAGVRILMLDEIPIESTQWQRFRSGLAAQGMTQCLASQRPVGVIDTLGHWPAYEASWSKNFRRALTQKVRRLRQLGVFTVERRRRLEPENVASLMHQAFVIEDKSWKGVEGTSVLRTPGMSQYMIEEAKWMNQAGALEIWFLRLNGQPIAFEYCHLSQGICYCHKIGFDPSYAALAPGKLLKYFQLQQYHDAEECRMVDTLGFLCPTLARWSTRSYQNGRLYASLGGPIADLFVNGYAMARPWLHRVRRPAGNPRAAPLANAYLAAIGAGADVSPCTRQALEG